MPTHTDTIVFGNADGDNVINDQWYNRNAPMWRLRLGDVVEVVVLRGWPYRKEKMIAQVELRSYR